MAQTQTSIGQATMEDLDGLLTLQAANQREHGGSLSGSLPRDRLIEMMGEMPLIVTQRNGRITGYLMTATKAMNGDVPVVRAMLAAYPGSAESYVYGPICVDEEERGKGLAQEMFTRLRRLMPGREGLALIRRDNEASLHAHARMGMTEVGGFKFDGADFAIFSFFG